MRTMNIVISCEPEEEGMYEGMYEVKVKDYDDKRYVAYYDYEPEHDEVRDEFNNEFVNDKFELIEN